MAPIARAENILQRADELVKMDKPNSALELLYDTINSKRTRFVALDTQEPLILKFIELSIDLRAGKNVRDALHQYKKMTVGTNTQALATAVDTFLDGCRKKVAEAQATAKQIEIDEEDLEAEQTPEDLLMATVSSEQKGADREVVTPWLKFLWEGYRSVLDVLRNNNKLEQLYSKVVLEAFQFCLEYQRKTEFRRLCELLRNHLVQAAQQAKQQAPTPQANPIDINDPETLQMLIGIRFEQLKVAVKLELWQEAFRSVEDIHVLFLASRRPIKINNLATYYETLAKICAVSNNYLFHAASWAKYYGMVYNTRETAPEGEIQRIASVFYLSVLCIPGDAGSKVTAGQNRLTTLLNMGRVPTRDALIAFALSKNILNYVRPEIRDLNRLLEADFHPLTLKKRLAPILESLGKVKVFHPYVKPLLDVVVNRTFLQLAQSYTTVRLDFIFDILSFAAPFNLSKFEIEKMLVMGNHKSAFKARINHQQGSVTFVDSLSTNESNSIEDVLQPTPATIIRNKLRSLATCIQDVYPQVDDAEMRRVNTARKELLAVAERGLIKENTDFLNRKKEQEERIKKAQAEKRRAEVQAAKERAEKLARDQQEEAERHAREQREQELALVQKEQKAVEDGKKLKIANEIKDKVKIDIDNLDKYTFEELKGMQIAQLNKEASELRDRMRAVARKQDYYERAYRLKEAELWKKDADEQAARDLKAHQARSEAVVAAAKARFERIQASHERYQRMVPTFKSFVGDILKSRQAEYEQKKAENEKLLEEAKKDRTEKEIKRREEEAQRAKEREAAIKEQQAKDEEARKALEAKRAASNPFGAARASAGAAAGGSGAYQPPSRAPRSGASPFGAAKPTSTGGSPFGAAKPTATGAGAGAGKASPFGAARPTATGPGAAPASKPSPFGNATPKPSPFGNATPKRTGASPFGAAKPVATGEGQKADEPAKPATGGAWKPRFKR